MTNEEFDYLKPGDLVELKSGGLSMAVLEKDQYSDGECLVAAVWMGGNGEIQTHDFPRELLKVASGVEPEQGQVGSDPRLTARPLWTVRGNKATVPKTGSTSTDKGQDAGGKGRDD